MATPDILRVRLSAEGIQEVIGALKKVESETKKVKTSMSGFGGELKNMLAGLGFAAAAAPPLQALCLGFGNNGRP